MSSEELFDVVDREDRVVEQLPRSVVHRRGLLHRAVHVFVRTSRDQLLVHLRSSQKDEYPSCWTSSASGHVAAGEDYDEAVHRELFEELGLQGRLNRLMKFPGSPETANEFTVLYELQSDDVPRFDREEIERVEYHDPLELLDRVSRHPSEYSPPFRILLAWYCEHHLQRRNDT